MSTSDSAELAKAPLLSHLLELRRRLLVCMGFFILAFIGAYCFAQEIYAFLMQPLVHTFGSTEHRRMIYTGLHEAFLTYVKLSFFTALFVTFPFILNQLWKFLAPGLYTHEKSSLRIFFWMTPVLFLVGAALAYYVVFPLAWQFFLGFETTAEQTLVPVELEPRVGEYLSLVIQLILAFGACFELPVALMLLARIGLVTAASLRQWRRYAIVIAYTVAAFLTPPDVMSQLLLGTPIVLLYEVSILLIQWSEKRSHVLQPAASVDSPS